MPEMSGPTAPDDASFTLPSRPGVLFLEHPRVDLLARESTPRRLPEGTAARLGVIGALVLFSYLVGGLTAVLVVIGVSALLSVSAALVTGHLSLAQAGGQRGAHVLLGVGAAALILGGLVSQQTRPAPVLAGTPVPVSSAAAVAASSTRATPTSTPSRAEQAAALASPAVPTEGAQATEAGGFTLSPDALAPRPAQADAAAAEVVPAEAADDLPTQPADGNANGNGNGNVKANGNAGAAVPPGQKAKGAAAAPGKANGNANGNGAGKGNGKANGNGKASGNAKGAKASAPAATADTTTGHGQGGGKAVGKGGVVVKPPKAKATTAVPLRHGFADARSALRDLL